MLGIRKIDKIPNARVRKFGGVEKVMKERIIESVFGWFGSMERMENNRVPKRVNNGCMYEFDLEKEDEFERKETRMPRKRKEWVVAE